MTSTCVTAPRQRARAGIWVAPRRDRVIHRTRWMLHPDGRSVDRCPNRVVGDGAAQSPGGWRAYPPFHQSFTSLQLVHRYCVPIGTFRLRCSHNRIICRLSICSQPRLANDPTERRQLSAWPRLEAGAAKEVHQSVNLLEGVILRQLRGPSPSRLSIASRPGTSKCATT